MAVVAGGTSPRHEQAYRALCATCTGCELSARPARGGTSQALGATGRSGGAPAGIGASPVSGEFVDAGLPVYPGPQISGRDAVSGPWSLLMETRLQNAVDRRLRKSDTHGAIQFLEERLRKEPVSRFKGLLGKGFTNKPRSILAAINKFTDACSKGFDVKAVYLEMNAFDVNCDRWYFDSFGYSRYEADPEDLDWLSEWQSPNWPQVTLNGLQPVRRDFEWYHANRIWEDESFARTYDLAELLVVCKYVSLIESALAAGRRSKPIPVLATAHDFDIMGRFEA